MVLATPAEEGEDTGGTEVGADGSVATPSDRRHIMALVLGASTVLPVTNQDIGQHSVQKTGRTSRHASAVEIQRTNQDCPHEALTQEQARKGNHDK